MGRAKGWIQEKTGRSAMRSPGRPEINQRPIKQTFWEHIAAGLQSGDAARACGVSQPLGPRWFRQAGGIAPYGRFADTDAAGNQFVPHLGPAVLLLDLEVNGPDMGQQGFAADAPVGARPGGLLSTFVPHVLKEGAGAHAQHVSSEGHQPMLLVPFYPGVLHFDTRSKHAVAFPRMPRSILIRAFSARSLASSICFGLTGLSPAPLS